MRAGTKLLWGQGRAKRDEWVRNGWGLRRVCGGGGTRLVVGDTDYWFDQGSHRELGAGSGSGQKWPNLHRTNRGQSRRDVQGDDVVEREWMACCEACE